MATLQPTEVIEVKITNMLGALLQGVFMQSAGSWGASITLDQDGNVVDELKERKQTVVVRKKRSRERDKTDYCI